MPTRSLVPVRPSHDHPIAVAGPVFLDVIMTGLEHAPRLGEEQWGASCTMTPGGWANQAVSLARLGLPVALRTELGQDETGGLVRAALADAGLDLSGCVSAPAQNVTVSLAYDGDRAMTTAGSDTAVRLAGWEISPSVLVTDLRHVARNEEPVRGWRSGAAPTAVVGDVGWDASGRWSAADLEPLELIDVFTPSDAEAQRYTRTDSPRDAARALARRGPLAVVTCGADGVVACSGDEEVVLPAAPVDAIDTTGAGDDFTAGLVAGLAAGLGLRASLSLASVTGGLAVGRPGGSLGAPSLAEAAGWALAAGLPTGPSGFDLSFTDLLG